MLTPDVSGQVRPAHRYLAWIGGVALLVLHLDFWRPQRVELYFGWLPEEMAYRVLWMFVAWIYLLFICARVWRDGEPP